MGEGWQRLAGDPSIQVKVEKGLIVRAMCVDADGFHMWSRNRGTVV